jgi:hypothetical protein
MNKKLLEDMWQALFDTTILFDPKNAALQQSRDIEKRRADFIKRVYALEKRVEKALGKHY